MTTITVNNYRDDPEAQKLADQIMAAAGIGDGDVALIESTETGWRCMVWLRDERGNRYLDGDEPAYRWVEVRLP